MTEHTSSTSAVVVDRIRSRITDLLVETETTTLQWARRVDDAGQMSIVRQRVTTRHPPLLVQLGAQLAGSTAGVSSSGPTSRPPGSLDGADCLLTMTRGAREWVEFITATRRAALPSKDRRAFVGPPRHAPLAANLEHVSVWADRLDRANLHRLDRDVLHWWAHARIIGTWDSPPMKPFVRCSECGRRGTLQVVSSPLAVACLSCGAAWDSMTIDELGEHLRLAVSDPIPDPVPEPMPPAGGHLDAGGYPQVACTPVA